MLCDGVCTKDGVNCGLWWDTDIITTDREGNKVKSKGPRKCGYIIIAGELVKTNERLVGIQQATEGNRNVGADVGRESYRAIVKGFKRLSKAIILKDNPALVILEDDDE